MHLVVIACKDYSGENHSSYNENEPNCMTEFDCLALTETHDSAERIKL